MTVDETKLPDNVIPFKRMTARKSQTSSTITPKTPKIPLYGTKDIKLVMVAIILFGDIIERKIDWTIPPFPTKGNLNSYPTPFIHKCLQVSLEQGIFSNPVKVAIREILNHVQPNEPSIPINRGS